MSVIVDDDSISYCGSISGETFASTKTKNVNSLRQRNVNKLAQKLREDSFNLDKSFESLGNATYTDQTNKPRLNKSFHQFRYVIAMFTGSAVGLMFLLRNNTTVAILSMVNHTALYLEKNPNNTVQDFIAEGNSLGGEFAWDNEIQQTIHSWYMIAYTLPQLPATKLGTMIGPRYSICISLIICSAANLLTPMLAYWGWEYVVAMRFLNGLGAASVISMMLSMIESWSRIDDISSGLTCSQITATCISASNAWLTGALSTLHWSLSFYTMALATLVFCVVWLFVVSDDPKQNWLISEQELDYITNTSIESNSDTKKQANKPVASKPTDANKPNQLDTSSTLVKVQPVEAEFDPNYKPTWIDVLRNWEFYMFVSIWIIYCSSSSAFYFIHPTYLSQFLQLDISQNGFYCTVIASGCIISNIWPHPVLKLLQSKLGMSLNGARKVTYAILCVALASCWLHVAVFHECQIIVFFLSRCFQNSTDIVVTGTIMAKYSRSGITSIAFSMINTIGNLAVPLVSPMIGYILDKSDQSVSAWTWILACLACEQLIALLIFVTTVTPEPVELRRRLAKSTGPLANTTQPIDDLQKVVVEDVGETNNVLNQFNSNSSSSFEASKK